MAEANPGDRVPGVQMRWGSLIPIRDGVRLSATLYLPEGHARPSPALFVFTPYVAQVHHEQGIFFAEHGYPFLAVDVRGRGNSEGAFHPLNDIADVSDTIEWIAAQPYCNGRVAMWGGSYSGYAQWAAIKNSPTQLATIVPASAPFRGIDSPMRNNVLVPYVIRWLAYLSGRTAQDRIFADQSFWSRRFRAWFESGTPFSQLDAFLGNPSPLFQEWTANPNYNAYWERYNPTPEEYARLSIPVLTITGAYDADQPGALMHYREHLKHRPEARSAHYLLIGPWDHSGTRSPKREFCGLEFAAASVLDLGGLHLEWYAWTLQGGPKPKFLQRNVAYYVAGADEWRYADSLEDITAHSEQLYLHADTNPTDVQTAGSLQRESSPGGGPDSYLYDPRDTGLAELESTVDPENRADQRMIHASRGKHLVYHSAPFTREVEISGFFKLSVWLSIDQPDTDLRAAVYEIRPDGSSIQLTADWQRARYRESLRDERLISTTAPMRYDLDRFTFISRRMHRGSRLRLVLGPINSIYSEKNYNSGGVVAAESRHVARPVTVRLFHDESRPSALYVPIGRSGEMTAGAA